MTARSETADPFATAPRGRERAGEAAPTPAFPVPGWERYQPLRFLGQGGMGRVFLARDPRLHRDVAIKLVRGDEPDLTRRLVLEARSQARVDHPRVCKVYEVGEVSGNVYIAMQFIAGKPLGELAAELNFAEKAVVIREAALGVHEAHRAGIVHRDLKPSNILVERAEDGSLRPCVLDFGLARIGAEGVTVSGAAVGTPHYMSPEQARGDTKRLDRRADVYSLGATLYHLLAGAPPIAGDNPLAVLEQVATALPRPLRAIDPAIPLDLEAIVFKCLEKESSARYDSARALAEDLDRFLNGEPVLARPAGALYRLRKRIERHRRLAAVSAAALAVALVGSGWGLKSRLEAGQRERQARRLAEIVERVEGTALYSALAPLHDTRPDRALIRARMAELEPEIRGAGALSAGPGHYALGRGFLALDERAAAREQLELAWQQGYREPVVAYSLALVLGDLYQSERLAAERLRDAAQREARKRDIERRYRDPALSYLKQAGAAGAPSPLYVEALLASYEDRLDDALSRLDAAGDALPWSYEAPKLRGDVLSTRAVRRWNSGDRPGALADFAAGRSAYARAAAIGESVAAVHEAAAQLEYGAMVMELYGNGEVDGCYERGSAAIARALSVDPDAYAPLVQGARFHRRMAEHRGNQGIAADDLIQRAIALAERAIAVAPERPDARMELGQSYWQLGQARGERGQDPSDALRRAVAIFDGFAAAERDYDFHTNLGLVHDTWADHESRSGGDPGPSRSKAIEAYRAATALDESLPFAWLNLGNAYLLRAQQPRCADPDGDLERATAALDRARAVNPEQIVAYLYSGDARTLAGQRLRARGGDAGPALARALELYRQGIARGPQLAYLHNGAGTVLLEQAREAWDRGAAPAPLLREAQEAFQQAIRAAPDQGFGYHNVGEALAQAAEYARAGGADPGPPAALAIPAIEEAIARLPDLAPPRANLGMVHAILATYAFEQGRDPEPSLTAAAAALGAALERNPEDRQSHLYLGEVRATRALYQAKKGLGGGAGGLESAAAEYQKAVDSAPDEPLGRLAFGHFCRLRAEAERAAGRDPEPALQRGLELCETLLEARPKWADARVLKAALLRQKAEGKPAEERRALAAEALLEVNAALAVNPNLAPRWRALAAAAQALAAAPR